MTKKISVLIVDDHAILREGIRALLETRDDIAVAGEAADGKEAVVKVKELSPDVVLMDIAMPLLNGIEATRLIVKSAPRTRVLVLSMHDDEKYVFQTLKAGAAGYLLKGSTVEDLVGAIKAVKSGNPFFSPSISRKIMESYLSDEPEQEAREFSGRLTNREKEVLQLIAEGLTNGRIAELMDISVKTVETHRAHIMKKLDLHDVVGLTKYAIRSGIIVIDK